MPTPTMLPTTSAVAPSGLRRWLPDVADGPASSGAGGGPGAGFLTGSVVWTTAVMLVCGWLRNLMGRRFS